MTHPNVELYESGKSLPIIPSCEHFAGSEKLIAKAYELQKKLGPIFDITCDCEDGCPGCVGPAGEIGIGGKEEAVAIASGLLLS